jgi:hypothetical protein
MLNRVGTRVEVWFANVVGAFARYVVDRTLPQSVPLLMRNEAVLDSFTYAKEHMTDSFPFLDRFDGLSLSIKEALKRFPSRELVLEFGVYKGGMINYQAKRFPNLEFVGFDSFEGLRESWSGNTPEKTFDLGGKLPKVRRNVTLVKGWFATSVPIWQKERGNSRIPLLVHVDCVTYSATADVLDLCSEYVDHGLIFHFDDYFGFPNWRNAAYKALMECSQKHKWHLTHLSYGTKEVAIMVEKMTECLADQPNS